MSNLLLAWPNWADAATLSGGSWQTELGLSNLLLRDVWRVARSSWTDSESTQLVANLDQTRPLRVVALLYHNLSPSAGYRLRLASDADVTTVVYDQWLSAAEVNGPGSDYLTRNPRQPRHLIHILPAAIDAQSVQIDIVDPTNPASYIEAGRLVLADGWQPAINHNWGLALGLKTATRTEELPCGTRYYDVAPTRRTLSFALDWLSRSEADQLFDLQREAGLHGQILTIPHPDDPAGISRSAFFATLARLDPLRKPDFARYQLAFEMEEIL